MALRGSTLAGALALALVAGCTSGGGEGGGGGGGGGGEGGLVGGPGGGSGSRAAARCGTGPLRLAGSPVQDPAVAEWVRAYRVACPAASVTAVPAAAGREAVLRGQVQLAAAELPPAADRGSTGPGCPGGRLVGLPVLAAPVTIVHSLPGLPALTVTPAVLARVYLGEVTEWSDPEIAVANPGVRLPADPITVLRPAPATAGTEALSRFLAAWVPDLWQAPPAATLPRGVAGTAVPDVAAAVRRTAGALAYLDGPVPGGRGSQGIASASVDTGSGAVGPTPAAVRSAVARADVEGASPDVRVTVDPAADEPGSYPLALVGYQVTCAGTGAGAGAGSGDAESVSVETFLAFATGDAGQAALERLGYAPLPNGLRGRVRAAVDALAEG